MKERLERLLVIIIITVKYYYYYVTTETFIYLERDTVMISVETILGTDYLILVRVWVGNSTSKRLERKFCKATKMN